MEIQQTSDFIQRSGVVTVGTSVVEVFPENQTLQRISFTMTNTSTYFPIFIAFGQDAVLNSGLTLYPGQTYTETLDAAFVPSNARITAISASAGQTLTYTIRS